MTHQNPPQRTTGQQLEELRASVEGRMRGNVALSLEVVQEMTPQEVQLLFHELHVHQMELEMQNEELRDATDALNATRARFVDLYDLAPVGYCTVNEAGLIVQSNRTLARLLGVESDALHRQPLSHFIEPADQDAFYLLRRQWMTLHDPMSCELRMQRSSGESIWVHLDVASASGDSTERRVSIADAQAAHESRGRQRLNDAAFQTVSQGIIMTTAEHVIVSVNAAFLRITGYSESEVIGHNCRFLQGPESDPHMVAAIGAALRSRTGFDGEILNYRKDGIPFWNALTISPVWAENGELTHFVGVTRDITAQKANDKALRISLGDKEALLKEVHHRVKNNLQIIISFLRMESQRAETMEAVNVLQAMQGRIFSMALLHESLYRTGTFTSVNLGDYLGQIAIQAHRNQRGPVQLVTLRLDVAAVHACMDQAIACGMLVNELVTNCLKHAFCEGQAGEVCVDLQPADPANPQLPLCSLRVSDNGRGLPADFEERRLNSLGLQLADDLSRQIGGSLRIDTPSGGGTVFSVIFKVATPVLPDPSH